QQSVARKVLYLRLWNVQGSRGINPLTENHTLGSRGPNDASDDSRMGGDVDFQHRQAKESFDRVGPHVHRLCDFLAGQAFVDVFDSRLLASGESKALRQLAQAHSVIRSSLKQDDV